MRSSRRTDTQLEPLLRKSELAHYLRRTERWIDQQVLLGMPYHQVGRGKRFERVAVLDWLDSQKAGGEADAA